MTKYAELHMHMMNDFRIHCEKNWFNFVLITARPCSWSNGIGMESKAYICRIPSQVFHERSRSGLGNELKQLAQFTCMTTGWPFFVIYTG